MPADKQEACQHAWSGAVEAAVATEAAERGATPEASISHQYRNWILRAWSVPPSSRMWLAQRWDQLRQLVHQPLRLGTLIPTILFHEKIC